MANVVIGSLLRLVLKPPKRKTPSYPMSAQTTPSQVEAGEGGVAGAGTVVITPGVNASGMTPEEEAYAAKKAKITKIVCIVGGLLLACWMLEIPLLPFLKSAAKWAKNSMKDGQKNGNGTESAGLDSDSGGIDVAQTIGLLFGS